MKERKLSGENKSKRAIEAWSEKSQQVGAVDLKQKEVSKAGI